jgi:hypothetical protein
MREVSLRSGRLLVEIAALLGIIMAIMFPRSGPRLCLWPMSTRPLHKMLTNTEIWGSDFQHLRQYLSDLDAIAERKIAVFPDEIEGRTRYDSVDLAIDAANTMSQSLPLLGLFRMPPFRIQSIRSGSDEYPHVTWTNSSNTFLQPSLTIRQVKGILCPLDAVVNEAIEGTPSLSEEYSLRNDPILRHFDLVRPTKREEELY